MQDTNQVSTTASPQATPCITCGLLRNFEQSLSRLSFAPGAGLLASLLAVLLMGTLRVVAGIPTPVELFGDFLLKRLDTGTFVHLFDHVFSPFQNFPTWSCPTWHDWGRNATGSTLCCYCAHKASCNRLSTGEK